MKKLYTLVIALLILLLIINNGNAATVELTNPEKLPAQLSEGEQTNMTIKIKDLDNVKQVILETSLVPMSGDKPLWDFGDLNQYINENRYQKKLTLDLSSLQQKIITVTIIGKAPDGETKYTCEQSDVIVSKFENSKLKLYEITTDGKLARVESFELIINKKQEFEGTMLQIKRSELDGLKGEARKLFDRGLVIEAQNIAIQMKNLKWPDSLTLFGFIKIENDLLLNGIFIIAIIIVFLIGYVLGARQESTNEDQ